MLFYPSGANKPKRVQGAFITEEEVEAIVSCIKSQNEAPKYQMEVLEETAADQMDPTAALMTNYCPMPLR